MKRLVALVLIVSACGGGSAPVTGLAADGQALFDQRVLGENAGCVTCHSLRPDVVLVGPSLARIGVDAASREPGVPADDYIRRSITNPDGYVLSGFDAGRMPQDWAEQLTPTEIDAIVEFLLTLGVDR